MAMNPISQILVASAAHTISGNSDTITGIVDCVGAVILVNVSAASGTTPTLDFTLQTLDPASATWVDLASLTQITTTGRVTKIVYPNASGALYQVLPFPYRIKWVIAGTTPSFTFSIGINYLP
jgi:hypothetical protein